MKILVPIIAALLVLQVTVNAQLTINPNISLQQGTAYVLGGSCATITNLTQSGSTLQYGSFTDASGFFGLTQGLIMASGNVEDAVGPNNSASNGMDFYLPGDSLLTDLINNYPDLPTPFYETHDATTIEFDFTSHIDDSVFVKYVFASEEYPEFVGTQFNDVFGFFVSGPGIDGEKNIAVVPGTDIPIAINLLNDTTYPDYYNDNAGGVYTQYDAYTIPLYAKFYALANVTYHIKLKIADAGDGIYDSAVLLESYPAGANNISGYITYQGNPATNGQVYLYQYDTDSSQAPVIEVQNIGPNGFYSFADLPIGNYIVKAELDQNVYPNTFPKYHLDAFNWDSATIINIPCANYPGDVGLLVLQQGSGTITGSVGKVGSIFKTAEPALAYVGANMLLVGIADNKVYRYTKSAEDGRYTFTDVPEGQFKIVIDIPGMFMDSVRTLTVNKSDTIITDQDYLVGHKHIFIKDIEVVGHIDNNKVDVYPNPVANDLILKFVLKDRMQVVADIYDLSGKKVQSLYNGTIDKGFNSIQYNVSGLLSGTYILRAQLGDEKHTLKLLKAN